MSLKLQDYHSYRSLIPNHSKITDSILKKTSNTNARTPTLEHRYAHKLDEPNTALDLYRDSLSNHFVNDLNVLKNMARLHDVLGTTVEGEGGSEGGEENSSESVRLYRNILRLDPTSVEAMSCLGTNDFFFFFVAVFSIFCVICSHKTLSKTHNRYELFLHRQTRSRDTFLS